jgi:hypothetical protein
VISAEIMAWSWGPDLFRKKPEVFATDETRMKPSAAFGRNQEKGRKIKGQKKSSFERAACKFPRIHFSAPDFFAFKSLKQEKH